MKIREQVKESFPAFVEENWKRWNEWQHTSNTHVWVEVYPNGKMHETEEPDDNTSHWLSYPDEPVQSLLEIAHSNDCYCDCDACTALRWLEEYKKGYITAEEYKEKLGFPVEDIEGQEVFDVLYDYDSIVYQDEYVSRMEEALEDIPYGYFEDEDEDGI